MNTKVNIQQNRYVHWTVDMGVAKRNLNPLLAKVICAVNPVSWKVQFFVPLIITIKIFLFLLRERLSFTSQLYPHPFETACTKRSLLTCFLWTPTSSTLTHFLAFALYTLLFVFVIIPLNGGEVDKCDVTLPLPHHTSSPTLWLARTSSTITMRAMKKITPSQMDA